MDVRRKDRDTSLANVAGEVEMEEEGDGSKLFQSEARETVFVVFALCTVLHSVPMSWQNTCGCRGHEAFDRKQFESNCNTVCYSIRAWIRCRYECFKRSLLGCCVGGFLL